MVKIKASKRVNYRHILIFDSRKKIERILKELNLKVKPKFKEIFVSSLKDKLNGKLVLSVAREDANLVRNAFKGKVNTIRTSGTLKRLIR